MRYPSARHGGRPQRGVVTQEVDRLAVRSERDVLVEFFTWAAANWKRVEHKTIGETVDLYLETKRG